VTNEDGSPEEMYNKGGEPRCLILKRRFAVGWMIGRAGVRMVYNTQAGKP
jgi:hypothetical protein